MRTSRRRRSSRARPPLTPARGPRRRRARVLFSAAALVAAAALAPCGGEAEPGPSALFELERLAFVPADRFWPGIAVSRALSQPARIAEPLLVDRYEVTRGEFRAFLLASPLEPDAALARFLQDWGEDTATWPVSFVTLGEAEAFARWRGMRLLSAGEWLLVAMGRFGRSYPWGTSPQHSVANTLDLRLERPAPVGTFESGRTPEHVHDLIGNVAEWVRGPSPVPEGIAGDARAAAFGGSFRTWMRPLYTPVDGLFAQVQSPLQRADDVGFRCAAPAREYLWTHAPSWGDDPRARARLFALGARWGRAAAPLLEELARRPGAPVGLAELARGARL